MPTVTIYLPKELHSQLSLEAESSQTSLSKIIASKLDSKPPNPTTQSQLDIIREEIQIMNNGNLTFWKKNCPEAYNQATKHLEK